ncbi:MAG: SDR family NAD(P)-dependent oxidoreductase [Ignavibacteriales bacterium]|nr:SDR family NAD(P)-dependent oxidoreductase [Ignavibacteriales bacterium]
MNLKGSVALVTGAGRGIGRSVALSLAKEGVEVILTARTVAELNQVKKEIESSGERSSVIPADLTDDRQIAKLFEELQRQYQRLDILVNNAGIGVFSPVRTLALGDFDRMWSLNMRAVMLATQHALKFMEAQKSGAIVNVASLAGRNAFIGGAGYAATKWALIGFSRSLMLEVREHNIRVVTICPGSVDTSFSPTPKDPSKSEKILHPQDVADTVLAALMLPERAMVSEIDIRPTNPK